MKTIRVTFTKPGAKAVCVMRYRLTDFPDSWRWSGDRKAFLVAPGLTVGPYFPLERIHQGCARQAALSGAEVTVEDLGGEAMEWRDEVLPPGELPPPMP